MASPKRERPDLVVPPLTFRAGLSTGPRVWQKAIAYCR
jgi:hypothetical protein